MSNTVATASVAAAAEGAPDWSALRIAVLVPCYNEEAAIEAVVRDFRKALPTATVYVYDNNSKDRTVEIARAAGAVVRQETRQGKGFVVRRMFADIEADIYIMVDGDDTYEAAAAPRLVEALASRGLDMVNGARLETDDAAYRAGHKFGNWMLSKIVRTVFGDEFRDMLSGYRVFSRRFVKSFPVMSAGFEIETELTIHALGLEMPSTEVMTSFSDRPAGSASKLNTFRDGFRILWTIMKLLKQERPMQLFSWSAFLLALVSVILIYPIVVTYLQTGVVPRFPTAILSTGLMLAAFLSFACGLILDTVTRGREEAKRMRYLAEPSVLTTLERLRERQAGNS
ncbi:glycosyltransferase family 2 protein [Oceanibacterium hippocampi]|uniref:Undecaprenyl-phosphate mannosyltransferase n=1 Tax=Oceanibacterium hippocampi TaxID=745714 RepID=A0A1Y5RX09_9PROT|nr:glycosyltransferase family 2 protein [Oceanibacterium hippocampi]SLN27273.1 Undecaprenyl-phosphate mannosyltransferase [Oceanibacterium hippocampi]